MRFLLVGWLGGQVIRGLSGQDPCGLLSVVNNAYFGNNISDCDKNWPVIDKELPSETLGLSIP
jgi:hypothetical protein